MRPRYLMLTLAATILAHGEGGSPTATQPAEARTIEREIPAAAEVRQMLQQWSHDGMTVLSMRARRDGSLLVTLRPAEPPDEPRRAIPYDDQQIARIRLGETTEARLLEWFDRPKSRDLRPDGRASLAWSLAPDGEDASGDTGRLSVVLAPDGTVAAYTASRQPAREQQTIEFEQESDADLVERQAQWAREGWNVVNLSAVPQPDGTTRRKAVLSRPEAPTNAGPAYDDQQIARIRRGETRESQLLDWFGRPERREVKLDGQAQLAWTFLRRLDPPTGPSGRLSVTLAPDGAVDAYSAVQGPE